MKSILTPNQTAVLFFVFLTGSSIINIPAPLISFSHNGAWISLLASASLGLLLLFPIVRLARRYPKMNYIEYASQLISKPLALCLGFIFLLYLIHMTSAIVQDIALFLKSSMMRQTDYTLFTICIFTAIALTIRIGIGRFAGMFGILIGSVMIFVLFNVALAASNFNWHRLLPVIDNGAKPLVQGLYFSFGFPYLEVILFTMILPYMNIQKSSRIGRKMAFALIANFFSLLIVTIATLLTFGPIAGERKYSMFEVARTIEVTEIFQRIEALMGYSMIVASFMKASISLFVAHRVLNQLLGLPKDNRQLTFPLTLFCTAISISVGIRSEAFWDFTISGIHPLLGITCAIVPFLLVYFVSLFRK